MDSLLGFMPIKLLSKIYDTCDFDDAEFVKYCAIYREKLSNADTLFQLSYDYLSADTMNELSIFLFEFLVTDLLWYIKDPSIVLCKILIGLFPSDTLPSVPTDYFSNETIYDMVPERYVFDSYTAKNLLKYSPIGYNHWCITNINTYDEGKLQLFSEKGVITNEIFEHLLVLQKK
jgi:hypothetical protein